MSEPTVEFAGEQFKVRKKVGRMAILRFAKVASAGGDSAELDGMAAMYDLLRSVIAKDEWDRFEQHAIDSDADDTELMKVVSDVIALEAGRPTSRPSGSSDGPSTTPPNSEDDSSSRVKQRLEAEGRPDLALMVVRASEARSASVA